MASSATSSVGFRATNLFSRLEDLIDSEVQSKVIGPILGSREQPFLQDDIVSRKRERARQMASN